MATKGSSRKWLREHFADPYVKQAHQAGYRSRAIFKLQEIQERDRIFKPGMTVVDLGAAPGGWSQYVVKLVKPKGRIIAIDLLPMEPIDGVEILQGDFGEDDVLEARKLQITQDPAGQVKGTVDFVLSDVAPNMSGHKGVDIPKAMYFAELALDFALQVLQPKGGFLIKVFQGEGSEVFLAEIKRNFKSVVIRKPKASRGRSREIYVLARELKKL